MAGDFAVEINALCAHFAGSKISTIAAIDAHCGGAFLWRDSAVKRGHDVVVNAEFERLAVLLKNGKQSGNRSAEASIAPRARLALWPSRSMRTSSGLGFGFCIRRSAQKFWDCEILGGRCLPQPVSLAVAMQEEFFAVDGADLDG